ncbi:MAG: proline iminopeptidase-family hydrolase [Ginsengibacter sp.]
MKAIIKSGIIFLLFNFYYQISIAQNKDSLFNAQSKVNGVKIVSILNGKYRVWTHKSGNGKIKLLLLHGGPGTPPEYFENFTNELGSDYTIYTYSQLGTYFSDVPTDTTIANVLSAAEQVEEVRKALGLDSFYLLGHSWGNLLAIAYASKYQSHLKGLILCNASIYATGSNQDYQEILIANMVEKIPEYAQYADSIRLGKIDNYTNPELNGKIMSKVMPIFIKEHYCRTDQLPGPVERSKVHSTGSKNMYNEYLTRDMNRFEFEPLLKKITVPTLFIGSKYDYIPPSDYDKMKNVIGSKFSKIYICPNGSHFDMWDDSTNFFRELNAFITQVDK